MISNRGDAKADV